MSYGQEDEEDSGLSALLASIGGVGGAAGGASSGLNAVRNLKVNPGEFMTFAPGDTKNSRLMKWLMTHRKMDAAKHLLGKPAIGAGLGALAGLGIGKAANWMMEDEE